MSDQVEFSFVSDNSQAIRELDRLRSKLDQLERRILKTAGVSRNSAGQFTGYGNAAGNSSGKVRSLGQASQRAAASIAITGKNASNTIGLLNRLGIAAHSAGKGMSDAKGAAGGLNTSLGALSAGVAGIGLGAAIASIIDTTAAFKGYDQALKIVTGSEALAGKEMSFVRDTADEAGFRVRDLAAEYVKLTAASKGTNMEGRNTRAIFQSITQAGAAYSLSSEQMAGALTAVQQMMSKGKVSAEELRGQLGERLPGAFQIAARAMGMSTKELDKLLQKGGLMADDFLPKFADQLRKEIPAGTQTATAGFNRMLNAFDEAKLSIGQSGFFDALAEAAENVGDKLNDMAKDGSLKEFGANLGKCVELIVTLLPYMKPLVAGFVAYKVAAIAATVATKGLTRAMLLNPALAIAAGVAALVLALDELGDSTSEATKNQKAQQAAEEKLAEVQEKRMQIIDDLNSATEQGRKAALDAAKAAREKAKQDVIAAKAALQHAMAEREKAAAMARRSLIEGTTSLRGAGGGHDPGRSSAVQARIDAANEADRKARESIAELRAHTRDLGALNGAIAADGVDTSRSNSGDGDSDKKDRKKRAEKDKYAETIKKLRAELADLGMTEDEVRLAQELESAGLERNIKLTGEKADAIRALLADIKKAEEAKQYNEALKEMEEAYAALALTETQLAQIEARRRAGLSTDLTVQNEQTKAIDDYAAAIERVTKAKRDADAAKQMGTDIAAQTKTAQQDTALANGTITPEQLELEREYSRIELERATRKGGLEKLAVITTEERRKGIAGITEEERQQLILANENLALEERRRVEAEQRRAEIERQMDAGEQLGNFLVDLWENPKEAMRRFFADLLRRLAIAIIQAAILKKNLGGGGGGIGGILGSAVLGALGVSSGRATGGSVSAGKTYMVGEKGPEAVRFGAAGQVFNHRKVFGSSGGSINLSPTYNIQLTGDPSANQQTLAEIKRMQAQQNAEIKKVQRQRGWQ